jgi:hypothetical protein
MPTYRGHYSGDDKECNSGVGLDDNAYNPDPKPNVYVSNAKGLNKIDLSKALDSDTYSSIGKEGNLLRGGFSGPGSRNRK